MRRGRPYGTCTPLIDRILLDEKTGCWNWRGARSPRGYGMAYFKRRVLSAHRLAAHLWLRISLNDSRYVMHRCDNPSCFNPKHLMLGTAKDNTQDCIIKGRSCGSVVNARKTHCPKGHLYSQENTRRTLRYGGFTRACRQCDREGKRRNHERKNKGN